MDSSILDLTGPVVFFPVRHHSPACARLLRQLALGMRPSAILIEGPSDFNPRLHEMALPHQLPIAIYSFLRLPEGPRRGAFYPFCIYSPEWQAMQTARELEIPARFIDLPWSEIAASETPSHRYADGELRWSDYVGSLCRKLGVEDFDTLWDTLFEIENDLTPAQYMERCHHFCFEARSADQHIPETDLRREAFMASEIRRAMEEFSGQLLVVTGGFHSYALYEEVTRTNDPRSRSPVDSTPGPQPLTPNPQPLASNAPFPDPAAECGISLTPYSYERLDSLAGYEAGMPNPGFYHHIWEDRLTGKKATYRQLLGYAVEDLRRRGQMVSSADLIAVETTARALASLRAHQEVWRRDLVDGIIGALVKEELEYGCHHPFLDAIYGALRGHARGRLAEGTELPPLVYDLRRLLHEHNLEPEVQERAVIMELPDSEDLQRSRVLHQVRILGIAGYQQTGGSSLAMRDDLARVWEQWRIRWSPDFDAGCIEAAIYGPTLAEAASARLLELSGKVERDAEKAALMLLDACLMGLEQLTVHFYGRLVELIREDGSFFSITRALGHLLYLYRYDEVLHTTGQLQIGALLEEAFLRGLWLLEGLGQSPGSEKELLLGVKALLETFERCAASLALSRENFVEVLRRTGADHAINPLLGGAITGALWTLGEAEINQVLAGLRYFSDPIRLGDFLTGLFGLARETVQRHLELVSSIDELLLGFSDEAFLEALPALRLAFTYFTPREKHYMVRTLLRARGIEEADPLTSLEVSPEMAAQVLAFESRLFAAVERYGLRGARPTKQETG